jgi:hypothetical protein
MNYYGRFYRSKLEPLLQRVSTYLRRWAGKRYKRLRNIDGSSGGGAGRSRDTRLSSKSVTPSYEL